MPRDLDRPAARVQRPRPGRVRARYHPHVRVILHVDMDAFFASVEQRDDPALRGKPVLVGGPSKRGVVAAASYEARPFGVRSAMPMAEALRRCPTAIVVSSHHRRYAEVSRDIFAVFRRYTPLVEGLSLDEAFLDVTHSASLFGDGPTIARRIKDDILRETELTASAGVAPCKFVAKIASDEDKPDGLTVVLPADVEAFLARLPIERMWGIGPRTAPRIRAAGYATLGDLANADPEALEHLLGSWGHTVRELARGADDREVIPDHDAKSIGAEETYERDLTTRAELEHALLDQSARVARRLVDAAARARIVTVKLKDSDFKVTSRRTTLDDYVDDTDSIFDAARAALARFALRGRRFRLTGVSVADIFEGVPPRTLFPDARLERRHALEVAAAKLASRFGDHAIQRAALLEPTAPPPVSRPAPARRRPP